MDTHLERRLLMQERIHGQIVDTYCHMAEEVRYRPAAPGDGLGNVAVPPDELDLDEEADQYAQRWWSEEYEGRFEVGTCNGPTRPATIFAIEAARDVRRNESQQTRP
jgi:hypothetical protein